jgi:hypothetical protein
MNRLHRDCFFFAATATLLAGCCTPAVVTEPGTAIRKRIKADGGGGIVEESQNLQLADKTRDGFTTIGAPQAQPIYGGISPPPTHSKRRGSFPPASMYHIKYNISILVALSAEPSPSKTSVVPTNNQYLRYRIWIPTDTTDNIGQWSDWTKSNDPKGPDADNSKPTLSGTPLESGKWHLLPPAPAPAPDKTITIQATVNNTQYTWTGVWSPLTKYGAQDPSGRGSITWTVKSP